MVLDRVANASIDLFQLFSLIGSGSLLDDQDQVVNDLNVAGEVIKTAVIIMLDSLKSLYYVSFISDITLNVQVALKSWCLFVFGAKPFPANQKVKHQFPLCFPEIPYLFAGSVSFSCRHLKDE